MKKRILLLLFVAVFAAFLCGCQANDAKQGMAGFACANENGDTVIGVAVAIAGNNNGAIEFAAPIQLAANNPVQIGIAVDEETIIPATIELVDQSSGVVILAAQSPIPDKKPVVMASIRDVSAGESITLLGYGPKGPQDFVSNEGKVLDLLTADSGLQLLATSCNVDGVCLGGPIINKDGHVIGFNMSEAMENGQSYAAITDGILNQTNTQSGNSGSSWFDYKYGIGLGGVALVGAVIGILIRKKRKPAAAEPHQPVSYANTAPVMTGAAAPSAGRSTVVHGVKGHFSGDSFTVSDRVAMGRDPKRCHIVFPSKTVGVSALHCELKNVSGGLELADRGSTYGTFLGSGEKLEVNRSYPLKNGDTFYLGSNENLFRVGGSE